MKNIFTMLAIIFFFQGNAFAQSSDSGTGLATVNVQAAIGISAQLALRFTQAAQGDGAEVIASAADGAGGSATFDLVGAADTPYTITLPGAINMEHSGLGGSPQELINVASFESTLGVGGNGTFDGSGEVTIGVGATRAAILGDQVEGDYSGEFTVSIDY